MCVCSAHGLCRRERRLRGVWTPASRLPGVRQRVQNPAAAAAGALGMEVVRLGGSRRKKGGLFPHREAHFGASGCPARPRGRGMLHCGKGAERGWPREWRALAQLLKALTAPGPAVCDAAVCRTRRQHRGRQDWREGDRGDAGSGALGHLQPLSLTRSGRGLPSSGTCSRSAPPPSPET